MEKVFCRIRKVVVVVVVVVNEMVAEKQLQQNKKKGQIESKLVVRITINYLGKWPIVHGLILDFRYDLQPHAHVAGECVLNWSSRAQAVHGRRCVRTQWFSYPSI